MRIRVVGLGQRAAGDDAVGLRVVEALRARGVPPGVQVEALPGPEALVSGAGAELLVVVDAALAEPAGRVLTLGRGQISQAPLALSSHGLPLADALELADLAEPLGEVVVVAVTISPPTHYSAVLSPEVEAAVEPAAAQVRALIEGSPHA